MERSLCHTEPGLCLWSKASLPAPPYVWHSLGAKLDSTLPQSSMGSVSLWSTVVPRYTRGLQPLCLTPPRGSRCILDRQGLENYSTLRSSLCSFSERAQTGTPILDCILPSPGVLPSALQFPAARQTCDLSPLSFVSPGRHTNFIPTPQWQGRNTDRHTSSDIRIFPKV